MDHSSRSVSAPADVGHDRRAGDDRRASDRPGGTGGRRAGDAPLLPLPPLGPVPAPSPATPLRALWDAVGAKVLPLLLAGVCGYFGGLVHLAQRVAQTEQDIVALRAAGRVDRAAGIVSLHDRRDIRAFLARFATPVARANCLSLGPQVASNMGFPCGDVQNGRDWPMPLEPESPLDGLPLPSRTPIAPADGAAVHTRGPALAVIGPALLPAAPGRRDDDPA